MFTFYNVADSTMSDGKKVLLMVKDKVGFVGL